MLKHEYTAEELAELKSIYDESGEAGIGVTGMLALREAGLLTQSLPPKPEDLRAVIADRLGTLHDAMLGVLSASFDAGDKVAYAYSCKLLSGEIMDLKANYSKGAK